MQGRADEVRAIAAEIERGVRAAADDAIEQLRAAEARRGALLQAQTDELGRSLEALERAAEAAAAACSAAEPPLAFLQRFRSLSDTCERLTLKPMREDIEARTPHARCCAVCTVDRRKHSVNGAQVSADAFEEEARAAVASQAERDREVLQKLLTVKDQMIWCVRYRLNSTLQYTPA